MRTANLIISTLILLANLYFIPETIWSVKNIGGPYYSIIPLLICLIINLMIFSALLTFSGKFSKSKLLFGLHIIGLILISLYSYVEIAIYLERS
jgi:hypothetical protein